ncbi:MAG TPA: ATP-binding protein [Candidatus Obscuribacterales bacterium]
MTDIHRAYQELVELIQLSDEQLSADLNETFLIFVRRLKRVLDFQAAALFYFEESAGDYPFVIRSYLGFQPYLEQESFQRQTADIYEWVLKRGTSICLPSDLSPGFNDLLIPLQAFQQKLGVLHLITSLDPLQISRHQQAVLNHFAHQMSRSLLYIQTLEQREQDLQHEKIHSMGLMLSSIMHEMNSPLTSIHGYMELLQYELQDVSLSETPREYLEIISSETKRVLEIVKSLLKFVRQQPLSFDELDVHKYLQATLSMLDFEFKQQHIRVHTQLEAGEYMISGEPTQIQQVFFNLLTNACHALKNLSSEQSREIWITTRSHKGWLIIEIRDNAGGISENFLKRIFDPFFTTKSHGQGTGLGLSLTYKIITEHRGQIKVRNYPQPAGASFELALPLSDAGVKPESPSIRPVIQPLLQDARVLVIDNEPAVLQYIQTLLTRRGYQLTLVGSGAEALKALKRENYDLIVSDLFLDDTSGFELYERVKEVAPQLARSMLFLTGAVLSPELHQFMQQHQLQCLYKPFYAQELLDTVARIMTQEVSG